MDERDDAFCAFVASRTQALRRTAYLLTGSHAAADDLLQTSLLKLYLAWPRIRDLGAVEAYVRTAMVRTQVSWWRRNVRRELPVADVEERAVAADRPSRNLTGSQLEDRDELWAAPATLGPRQRAVLVLRFYEDLTEAEIARVLDCSVGTVKSQLSRGLARLRERITIDVAGNGPATTTTTGQGR